MGCASSTEMHTDPMTGQTKTKHRLGGAHPGNRRTPQQAYAPGASEFDRNDNATAHFVSYGGGNALVLQQNAVAQPQSGGPEANPPTYIQVTLPSGVKSGDKIHVQAPDGRLNEIIVPNGFGPGSTFTVEFADEAPPPEASQHNAQQDPYAAPVTTATYAPTNTHNNNNNNNNYDDGFATAFNNPNFVPTAPATTSHGEAEIDMSSYPSAQNAKPVLY